METSVRNMGKEEHHFYWTFPHIQRVRNVSLTSLPCLHRLPQCPKNVGIHIYKPQKLLLKIIYLSNFNHTYQQLHKII